MRHRPTPATRDARARQLPTVTSHAVPTRECQSDPPSPSRAIRCSQPRGQPTGRDPPLDVLLHVRGVMWGRWLGPRRIAAARWDPPPCTGCDHRPHITPPEEAVRGGGRRSLLRYSVRAASSLLPVKLNAISLAMNINGAAEVQARNEPLRMRFAGRGVVGVGHVDDRRLA